MSIAILASLGVFTLISVITLLVLVLAAKSSVSKLDKSLTKLEDTVKKTSVKVASLDEEMGAL
jgi:hypothetical protein